MSVTIDLSLVAAARDVLDYTTEDIEYLHDEKFNGKFDAMRRIENLRELDRLEFQCHSCGYWKPQRENATPKHSAWTCKECDADGT